MELKVKNFQSLKDISLEFPEGQITALLGESNQGKSSVLRAIRAVVTNPQGSGHYVQHGKNKTEVTLANNGNTLTWERTKSTTNYKYNDEVFTKCSKQDSSVFCDLGFVYDQKGKLLNLSGEWDTLFPFALSDTELFKLFEDLFSIIDSAKILDGMRGDETSCNKDKLLTQDKLKTIIERKERADSLIMGLGDLAKPEMIKLVIKKKYEELKKMRQDFNNLKATNPIVNSELNSESFKTVLLDGAIKSLADLYKSNYFLNKLPQNLDLPLAKWFEFDNSLAELKKAELSYANEVNNQTMLEKSKSDLESTLEKLKEQYNSIDVCPLCGGEWKGNR